MEWTTIRVNRKTTERLRDIGKMKDSYDDVIVRLIEKNIGE